jgi:hypothetical protein
MCTLFLFLANFTACRLYDSEILAFCRILVFQLILKCKFIYLIGIFFS